MVYLLGQEQLIVELSSDGFIGGAHHKSKVWTGFKERVDFRKDDVFKLVVLHLGYESCQVGLRVLVVRLRADVDVQLEVLNFSEEPIDSRAVLFALSDSNCEELFGIASCLVIFEDGGG